MFDVTGAREDAHLQQHDDFMEAPVERANLGACSGETAPLTKEGTIGEKTPGASELSWERQMIDFGNRLEYYLRTRDRRAWEYRR